MFGLEENDMFLLIFFFILAVIVYVIFHKKEKPRDIFFTSHTSIPQAKVIHTVAIKQKSSVHEASQGLKNYPVYRYISQIKNQNNFIHRCWEMGDRLTERYPQFFEKVFICVCAASKGKNGYVFWNAMKNLTPVEENIARSEYCMTYSLAWVLFCFIFAFLLGGSFFVIGIILSLILLANVVYCVKKINQEIEKQNIFSDSVDSENNVL